MKVTVKIGSSYKMHFLDAATREAVIVYDDWEDRTKLDELTFERRRRSGDWPVSGENGDKRSSLTQSDDRNQDGAAGESLPIRTGAT
jgi:hypothetical protein